MEVMKNDSVKIKQAYCAIEGFGKSGYGFDEIWNLERNGSNEFHTTPPTHKKLGDDH